MHKLHPKPLRRPFLILPQPCPAPPADAPVPIIIESAPVALSLFVSGRHLPSFRTPAHKRIRSFLSVPSVFSFLFFTSRSPSPAVRTRLGNRSKIRRSSKLIPVPENTRSSQSQRSIDPHWASTSWRSTTTRRLPQTWRRAASSPSLPLSSPDTVVKTARRMQLPPSGMRTS